MSTRKNAVAIAERIDDRIVFVRGLRVMLDDDLAELYGVTTSALRQAVKRNARRFPRDFAFSLSNQEVTVLRSQSVISRSQAFDSPTEKRAHGGRRHAVLAFTEQGVAMLSSVLSSPRAIAVNIEIMRAFVRLRQFLATHEDLARRLDELEREYDEQFAVVFTAIRQLMDIESGRRRLAKRPKQPIGFRVKDT